MSERLLERRFAAAPKELQETRRVVRGVLAEAGASDDCARDVVLAVDEACQNVIRHAYGPERSGDIELTIERDGDALVVTVVDWAPRVDPQQIRPRELDDVRPGGLGTFLIQEVMDAADFVEPPPGCGNLLRMVKRIA